MVQLPPSYLSFLYQQGPLDPLVPQAPPEVQVQLDLPVLKVPQDPLDQAVPLGQMVLMVVMEQPPGLVHQRRLQDQ